MYADDIKYIQVHSLSGFEMWCIGLGVVPFLSITKLMSII